MIERKHTPGPWVTLTGFTNYGHPAFSVATDEDDPWFICSGIFGCDENNLGTDIENKANARLIAAAPDLLAACEAALAVVGVSCRPPGGCTPGESTARKQLAAAIKKALEG